MPSEQGTIVSVNVSPGGVPKLPVQREGHPIAPGSTGENLTIRGLDWDLVVPGATLRTGGVIVEITAYASPCSSIRPSFADGHSNRISQKKHPGWSRVYARVASAGEIRVGDEVTAVETR